MLLTRRRYVSVLLSMLLLLIASSWCSLLFGPSELAPGEVWKVLFEAGDSGAAGDIVLRIRLPRTVLALLVGASLSVSGVVFQALLRNPLADPFVLGVSGGAALGGIVALTIGSAMGFGYAVVPPAAFAGALLTTALLYLIAGAGNHVSANSLLLTGVVFNAFASAAIVFLASIAGLTESSRIFLWLIGNLSAARSDVAPWVAVFLMLGLASSGALARSLNLLILGDEPAEQLGVPTELHKRILLLATSLMVGAAVSVAGLVGFVGLIIPHLLRLCFGPDHRLLIPAAALGGGAFLVICDTVARTMLGGRELPVGAITALVGGPLFLFLLRRQHQRIFAP
ncbi:MAG: iron ABC transporter permease [Myxococcales bacterium]|nr:iron ABC transporter permease [Myxococcales bacterium]